MSPVAYANSASAATVTRYFTALAPQCPGYNRRWASKGVLLGDSWLVLIEQSVKMGVNTYYFYSLKTFYPQT